MTDECTEQRLLKKLEKDIDTNCKTVKTKVSTLVFFWTVGILTTVIFGSYGYTYRESFILAQSQHNHEDKANNACEIMKRRLNSVESSRDLDKYKYQQIDGKLDTIIDIQKQTLKQSQDNRREIDKLKWQSENN